MRWPWQKKHPSPSTHPPGEDPALAPEADSLASLQPETARDFSFYWFFLVFWLTVIATVLISWQMII